MTNHEKQDKNQLSDSGQPYIEHHHVEIKPQGNYTRLIIFIAASALISLCMFPSCTESSLPQLQNARRGSWENRCKLTLRALGSSQLAFQYGNKGSYGSFEELQKQEYIQPNYTIDNIIDHYRIITFDVTPPERDGDEIVKESTFRIIAIPINQKNHLRTFGICEDQTPRVWVGEPDEFNPQSLDFTNVDKWEPIR
jgi:hypothetical protein